MLMWNILSVVSLALFVINFIILITIKFRKYRYLHKFVPDELFDNIKDSKSLSGKNRLFSTPLSVREYMKKYVLSFTGGQVVFIGNYTRSFNYISYYIYCYNYRNKLVDVFEVSEANTSTTSRMIALTGSTRRVNVLIKNVDGLSLNTQITKTMSKPRIHLYSLLFAFQFFLFLFNVRQLVGYFVFAYYFKSFMLNPMYNLITIGAMLVFSVFVYVFMYLKIKRRNLLNKRGGIVDNEFF